MHSPMPSPQPYPKRSDNDLRRSVALMGTVVTVHDSAAFEARARADPNVRYVSLDRPDVVQPHFTPNGPQPGPSAMSPLRPPRVGSMTERSPILAGQVARRAPNRSAGGQARLCA